MTAAEQVRFGHAAHLCSRRGRRRRAPGRRRHRPGEARPGPPHGVAPCSSSASPATRPAVRCRAERPVATSCSTSSRGRARSSSRASRTTSSPKAGRTSARARPTRSTTPGRVSCVSSRRPCRSSTPTGRRGEVIVRFADRPELRADAKRTFRYLVNQEAGCMDATQFVGIVEPCRAPDHSHTYDEVGYIVDGRGIRAHRRRIDPSPPGLLLSPPTRAGPLHREHGAGRDADPGRVPSLGRSRFAGLRGRPRSSRPAS